MAFRIGSVEARSFLWQAWARIAVEHELEAHKARQEYVDEQPRQSIAAMGREVRASLVAVAAAAFSIDALANELAPFVGLKQGAGGPARARILAAALPDADVQADLTWLDGLRNGSVHFVGKSAPMVRHPAIKGVVPADVASYSVEASSKAVDVLLRVVNADCASCSRCGRAERGSEVSARNPVSSAALGCPGAPQRSRIRWP